MVAVNLEFEKQSAIFCEWQKTTLERMHIIYE